MVSLIEAVILSIFQGISEWFPISSSGHLALVQNIFGFQNLSYDVFLHFASIFAVVFVFRKDIKNLLNLRKKQNWTYLFYLIIATIPAVIVGVLFRDFISSIFSNLLFLSSFFIFSGIIIYLTKFARPKIKFEKFEKSRIGFLDSIFIGLFQALAVFPGISRSGMTISSGLFRKLKKEQAIKFSFFLAIIIIFAGSIAESTNIFSGEIDYFILLLSFVITLLVSIFTIKVLLKIIKTNRFYLFGIYNILLGIFILIWKLLSSMI